MMQGAWGEAYFLSRMNLNLNSPDTVKNYFFKPPPVMHERKS